MTRSIFTPLILALGLLAACRPDRGEAPPGEIGIRQDATRDACVARQLLARGEDNLTTLAQFQEAEGDISGAGAQTPLAPARAAYEYARIYHHHAELRNATFAHLDSALNHARSSADSLRHVQTAASYRTPAPEPGSIDANAIEAYERDRAALRADEDHRCNWDI